MNFRLIVSSFHPLEKERNETIPGGDENVSPPGEYFRNVSKILPRQVIVFLPVFSTSFQIVSFVSNFLERCGEGHFSEGVVSHRFTRIFGVWLMVSNITTYLGK
jgi:hypothetical protein